MNDQGATLSHRAWEQVIRVAIAVIGLLVLRGIVSVMPMLRTDPVYVTPLPGLSLSGAQVALTPQQIQQALSNTQTEGAVAAIQQALLAAEYSAAQSGSARLTPLQVQNEILMSARLAIFPITIAKAVIDTLIFGLLFLFARSLASLFRGGYSRLPDLGQMIYLGILTALVGVAYRSYEGLAYPLLFPDNLPIYGWVFLVLALAPLIALAVVVARNMDAITALVMQSGSARMATPVAAIARCANCGQPITYGIRFCPNCAVPVVGPVSAATVRLCSSCGIENTGTAKFCKECGKPV